VRRPRIALLTALIVVAAAACAYLPASASAIYLHPTVTTSFGPNGTSGTTFPGTIGTIAFDQALERLYVTTGSDNKIYAFDTSTPGTYTPLNVGNGYPSFPISNGAADIAVDNTSLGSAGNIYTVSNTIYAFSSSGSSLFTLPASQATQGCGVAVDPDGHVWVSHFSGSFDEFQSSGGASLYHVDVPQPEQYLNCYLAFAPSGDLYNSKGSDGAGHPAGTYKYFGPDYTSSARFSGDAGKLTFDPITNHLYSGGGDKLREYDPDGTLVETFGPNFPGTQGIAGDWARGIVYASNANTSKVMVIPGVYLPDLTTSAPTGFATLNGHVELGGGGDVTECHFQWGTSTPNYPGGGTKACTPSIPPNYSGPTDVSADLSSAGLTLEQLYHYRLEAANAGGQNFSADATFTPHYVSGLKTDPATSVNRNGATLHADYIGTNDDTHYYFEWGKNTGLYTRKSVDPPGDDDGTQTGPRNLSFTVSSGLASDTTYYYRVVASNTASVAAGKTSVASEVSFHTPPAVTGVSTDPVNPIGNDNADLNGSFTGEGIDTQYHFEYGTTTSYGTETPTVDLPSPSGATQVAAHIDNLKPHQTYHVRLVATNTYGTTKGNDLTFTTTSPPVIIATSTSGASPDSVNLNAAINPEGYDTYYHFEYGKTAIYGSREPTSDLLIPAGNSDVHVSVHLTGLDGRLYHFRVVATSVKGEADSVDQSFNFYPPTCPNEYLRQQTDADNLPDCRAYELVTPAYAGSAVVFGANEPFSPHATSPSRLAFETEFGRIPGVGNPANMNDDPYVATRTDNGWQSRFVGLPGDVAPLMGGPAWALRNNIFSTQAQKDVLTNGSMSRIVNWDRGAIYCPPPLVAAQCPAADGSSGPGIGHSNAPYVWDSNTGALVDRWPTNVGAVPNGVDFEGRTDASPDLSHFIFTSDIPFLPGGKPNDPTTLEGDVYDNDTVNGTLSIVSRDSGGSPIQAAPVHTSDDGSHILMTVGGGRARGAYFPTSGPGELFMRVDDAMTYDIAPGNEVQFVGMTPDGSKVYFLSNADLTPDHSDLDTSADLYMWSETSTSPNHLTLLSRGNNPNTGNTNACSASWTSRCNVTSITFTNPTNPGGQFADVGYSDSYGGEGGSPYSDNIIAPENGDVYFLSPEQLDGSNGVKDQVNLYVFRDGKDQFVAALTSGATSCDRYGFACSDTPVARLETTPNDSKMAFLTSSRVTGYDNAGYSEMYTYTPATGEILCVSCLPSGDPPIAEVRTSHNGRFITDDGRVFFDTSGALVPEDTNETTDTYEYVDGRPQLISSGTSPGNDSDGLTTQLAIPGLIGVSADGADVYFETYDTLVGQDLNGDAAKIYDARSGGGFPSVAPPPPCAAADECHGPGSSAPAGISNDTGSDLGATGNLQAAQNRRHRHKRHRRHGRVRHQGGRRNG
jgi:hypothetical protein